MNWRNFNWQTIKSHPFGKAMTSMAIGEIVGDVVGVVANLVSRKLFPSQRERTEKWLKDHVVLPHLEAIEPKVDYFAELEGERAKTRQLLPREHRAHEIAKLFAELGIPIVPGWAAKIGARHMANKALGIKATRNGTGFSSAKVDIVTFLFDEGAHVAATLLENSGLSGPTHALRNAITSVLQKLGVPKEDAESASFFTVVWGLPNFVGYMSGSAAMYLMTRNGHAPTR